MNRLKTILPKQIAILGTASLLMMGAALLLAWKISPWLYAINVPVKLYLQAPANAQISVCWDKAQAECLPLVPYLSHENSIASPGEIADVWLSELPPRPAYTVSIIFKSQIKNAIGKSLYLDSRKTKVWGNIPGAGIQDMTLSIQQFKKVDVTYQINDNQEYLSANKGGRLINTQEIQPGPPNRNKRILGTITIWLLFFSIYLFFAIPLALLPGTIKNIGLAAQASQHLPSLPKWVYLFLAVAIIVMFALILHSPMSLDQGDDIDYLKTSLGQAWMISVARPPGYYMVVAWVLGLFKNELNGITFLQVVVFALATSIFIWTLRKWLHPLAAVLVIVGILFSPSQAHWMLSVMRESLYTSLVMVGTAAAIAYLSSANKISAGIWLAVFSVICWLALLIRENGILLPGVLFFALLLTMIKNIKASKTVSEWLQSIYKPAICCMIPLLCTGTIYFGMSFHNYTQFGYFQFTRHSTSHDLLWAQISTANFDARNLLTPHGAMQEDTKTYLGPALYSSFIWEREKEPSLDPIYTSLFPTVQRKMIRDGHPDTPDRLYTASIMNDIGRGARTLLAWQADLIGLIRQYREFLIPNYHEYTIGRDDPTEVAAKQEMLQHYAINVTYHENPIPEGSIIAKYDDAVAAYGWYYILFILGLVSALYLWRYDDPIFVIPILLFIANAFLFIALRNEHYRYIESLDILLILQIGLALSSWARRHITKPLKENRRSSI